MPAQFHCEATHTIPKRQHFVICGRIIEGTVRVGMRVLITVSPASELILPI